MKNILIIDSGVGAIGIYKEIRKKVNANYYIYIDNKNAPYGKKSTEELNFIAQSILSRCIVKYKIDLVVVACNTLTVSSITYLRNSFDVVIVGTEPNIKMREVPSIVLCTEYTYNNCQILKNSNLDKLALPMLATLIDNNLQNLDAVNDYLKQYYDVLKKYKAISLGCTHYTFVASNIKKLFPFAKIYENKFGVANRVYSLLGNSFKNEKSHTKIILSMKNSNFKKSIYRLIKDN